MRWKSRHRPPPPGTHAPNEFLCGGAGSELDGVGPAQANPPVHPASRRTRPQVRPSTLAWGVYKRVARALARAGMHATAHECSKLDFVTGFCIYTKHFMSLHLCSGFHMKTLRKLSNFQCVLLGVTIAHICLSAGLIYCTCYSHKMRYGVISPAIQRHESNSLANDMEVRTPTPPEHTPPVLTPRLLSGPLLVDGTEACAPAESLRHFGKSCHDLYRGPNSTSPQYLCLHTNPPESGSASKLRAVAHGLMLPTPLDAATKCDRINLPQTAQRFSEFEFGCYSQNTEDGILLLLFRMVGVTNRRVIEIAGGVGWENNAINLVVNFGFDALIFDGDAGNSRCAHNFIHQHTDIRDRVKWSSDFVTRDNLNAMISRKTGWTGDIDLFSLDIDGVDYWIWDALMVVRPRVVVVETQELWGAFESKTRPYNPRHVSPEIPAMGASLAAFTYLAKRRGYRLIGCMKLGFNAFFVREDAVPGGLDSLFGSSEYNPEGCFGHVDAAWADVLRERRRAAQKYSWIDPSDNTKT